MNILLYLLLAALVWVAVKLEKRDYGTYLTPFCLISVPVTIILGWLFVVVRAYGFPDVSVKLILCDYLFFFVFWLPSLVARYFIKRRPTQISGRNLTGGYDSVIASKADRFMALIVLISAFELIAYFIISARHVAVLGNIVQEEFQKKYTGGFNFFPRIVCLAGTAYFIGTYQKAQKYKIAMACIALLPIVMSLVKGIIFMPIIAGLILYALKNPVKINFKKVFLIPACGVLIFFGAYMVENGIWGLSNISSAHFYQFIFAKFNVYLISGTESFNINLIQGNSFNNGFLNSPAFAPLINLLSKFSFTDRVDSIGSVFTVLGTIDGYGVAKVNTDGFFGILVLYSGFASAILTSFLFSGVSYVLFVRSMNSNNLFYRVIYALIASGIFLGWFDFYFMQTFWYYLWFMLECLAAVFQLSFYNADEHSRFRLAAEADL